MARRSSGVACAEEQSEATSAESSKPNRISSSDRGRSDRFKLDRLPWPVCPTRHGMAWNCNLNCNPEDRWVHWPLCAYRHSMDATLAWTIVGSLAGVAAVISGVGFGVVQLRQGRAKTGVGPADDSLAGLADAYVSNVTGPMAGPGAGSGVVLAGEVPQEPPAFQPREDLLAAMRRSVPGRPVVQVVTGMRGVGKTQLAAAYARSRIGEGWRLVAWVNAGDTAKVLNGLAEVAARLGIGRARRGPGGHRRGGAALAGGRRGAVPGGLR